MKFRIKITLCMIGLLSVLFGIGGSILMQASFDQTVGQEKDETYRIYRMVSGPLKKAAEINGSLVYDDIVEGLSAVDDQGETWEMLRFRLGNDVIYEAGETALGIDSAAPEEGQCQMSIRMEGKRKLLFLSGLILTEGEPVRMDMARDITGLFDERENWQNIYQGVFLILILICAGLSYTTAGILTRPLKQLSTTAREIAGGKLSSRAKADTEDEIGLLGREFNIMADRLEEKICELNAEMENQERFIGSFSHELKTPMTSIIGYADLMRNGMLDGTEQAEAAKYIFSEGKRLENLSMKLLDIMTVKNISPSFVMASPAMILGRFAEDMAPFYKEKNITLQWNTEEGECRMEPDLFYSLVLNLVDNAAKAVSGREGRIVIVQDMRSYGCRIFVKDNGRGIPPEALGHLTEAFYRVDKSRSRSMGGAGLGLALCSEIARAHGGYLRFKSRKGTGTVVMAVLKGGRGEEEK